MEDGGGAARAATRNFPTATSPAPPPPPSTVRLSGNHKGTSVCAVRSVHPKRPREIPHVIVFSNKPTPPDHPNIQTRPHTYVCTSPPSSSKTHLKVPKHWQRFQNYKRQQHKSYTTTMERNEHQGSNSKRMPINQINQPINASTPRNPTNHAPQQQSFSPGRPNQTPLLRGRSRAVGRTRQDTPRHVSIHTFLAHSAG